jgi:hypothetical protein
MELQCLKMSYARTLEKGTRVSWFQGILSTFTQKYPLGILKPSNPPAARDLGNISQGGCFQSFKFIYRHDSHIKQYQSKYD